MSCECRRCRRAPSLADVGLDRLVDQQISADEDAYNAVNTPRLTDAVARVLTRFGEQPGAHTSLQGAAPC